MSINDIQSSTTTMQSAINTGEISKSMMSVRILGILQVVSSLLIIVGLVVGILYIIKTKKTIAKKIIIGLIIIIIPIILNLIVTIIKFNIVLNEENIQSNEINSSTNISNSTNNTTKSDKIVDSMLWISNYKNMPAQKTKCTLNLFGSEHTKGLVTPIELEQLNEFVATYKYSPYKSSDSIKISNLSSINDDAVSSFFAVDKYDYFLFEMELYGEGLSFKECIEQGKFLIKTQGNIIEDFNIPANQIGLNIPHGDKNNASNTLDAIIDNLGSPTYIVANEDLGQITLDDNFDIEYKLIYEYNEYAIAFYVEEELEENDEKSCAIKYMYYYPIEFFKQTDVTELNHYKYKLK